MNLSSGVCDMNSDGPDGSNPRVCVYCASSRSCDPVYHQAAFRLGVVLADLRLTVVYGGGGAGSMGALADGALSRNGQVVGILPRFMIHSPMPGICLPL